jgi:hypothetical protein
MLRIAGERRLPFALATLAVVSIGALGLSAAPAFAEDCPNAALRAENSSTRLPECRAYEMVTSPFKEGFAALEGATYSDEGAYGYASIGNFAENGFGDINGNQYVATRSAAGWKTISMNPPGDEWDFYEELGATNGLSNDLRSSVWMMHPLSGAGSLDVYVRRPDGSFSLIGPNPGAAVPRVFARSADLSHLVVGGDTATSPVPDNLYEYTDSEHAPRPIEVDNTGAPLTPHDVGCGLGMSEDGRVIFFGLDYPDCSQGLWVRVGATTTIDPAASQCTRTASDPGGVCNGPAQVQLAGKALDGSRVLFTTTQQLVNGDTDQTNDLYACDIPPGAVAPVGLVNPCPSLTEVSGAASNADVENVTRVSDDGSRVYFVARGVLASNLGANDQAAAAGANNLYVWQKDAAHPAGHTTFMARLLVDDVGGHGNVETTPDGRYLLINTTNPLVTIGPAADTDGAIDVYRYDADTGRWLRLSTDTTGTGGNAEMEALSRGSTLFRDRPRVSITADGSTVVFQTAEALSPNDTDGVNDVYEWHEGQVSLISPDGGGGPRITSSGTDIFFTTGDQLTAADGDTNPDEYDARVGGGFSFARPQPCSGEACQGPLAPQPQLPGPSASTSFSGPGNVAAPVTSSLAKPTPKPLTNAQKLRRALKACQSRHNKRKRSACEKKARATYRRGK